MEQRAGETVGGAELRRLLKRVGVATAFLPVAPLVALARIGGGSDGLFHTFACLLSLIPGRVGSYVRVAYYRGTLRRMSPEVSIGFGSLFSKRSAEVGRRVAIGAYSIVGDVELGEAVNVGSGVSVLSGKHQHGRIGRVPSQDGVLSYTRISIGRGTWIGERAVVMADVGKECIVAAGSVVTRAIPDGFAVAGNPARPVGRVEGAGVGPAPREVTGHG